MIMAELVLAGVERDLVEAEGAEVERRLAESARKIELQGSLVEVLEAERMVLLGENARLGFRAAAAEEEARAEVDRLREENRRLRQEAEAARARRGSGRSWWERVRRFDWAPASCAPHVRESKVPKNCFYI
ncbi:unnamed protein product [Musa acuminata var. zebrina]